jgi:hypothetical protein
MVRFGRLSVRISILTASLLLAIAAAAGTHLVFKTSGPDVRQDGFLAYGQVSVAIFGDDATTLQTKRCMANSVQAGIDVRQGTPVTISLDGRAVGGGNLSTGKLKQKTTRRGDSEFYWASCQYKFSAPVTWPGEGQYTLDIGDAKVAFSMDDLRKGVNLELS